MLLVQYLILIPFLFLIACGGSNKANVSTLPSTESLNQEQEDKFQKAHKPMEVKWDQLDSFLPFFKKSCENCPPSFGHFLGQLTETEGTTTYRTSFNCQGGLVAEDLFLTNRHCLPEDLLNEGANCEGRAKIIFPEISDQHSLKVVECEKVIKISETHEGIPTDRPQPDWALIKLKETLKERFNEVDQNGIEDKEKLFAYSPLVDPSNNNVNMQKIECIAIQNSFRLPDYNHIMSPIVRLKCNRDFTKRFSGSLLYKNDDIDGEPVGIISHIWDKQINKEEIRVSPFVVATNFSCLTFGEDKELNPNCEFIATQRNSLKTKLLINANQEAHEFLVNSLDTFLADETQPVVWQKTDLEKISEMNSYYQDYLQKLESNISFNLFPKDKVKYFFHALIPINAKCLKKESVPEKDEIIQGKTPVISVSILRNSEDQVVPQQQLEWADYVITKSRHHSDKYFIEIKPKLPPFKKPGNRQNRFMSERFHHNGSLLPICP